MLNAFAQWSTLGSTNFSNLLVALVGQLVTPACHPPRVSLLIIVFASELHAPGLLTDPLVCGTKTLSFGPHVSLELSGYVHVLCPYWFTCVSLTYDGVP